MKNHDFDIAPELVGIHCLNFGIKHNSPSRSQMLSSHLTSKIVIDEPEPVRSQSGGEHEFGKYTSAIRMPANGRVIAAIPFYQQSGGINFNPETFVIYEDSETHVIGCFRIPYYSSYHQYFGFKNKLVQDNLNRLVPGTPIKKGTLFAHSPGLGEYNNYMYGHNLNVALMSWPGTAEDGIVISRDVLHKFRFRIFETRTVNIGSRLYPRLIYGNNPFPEVGEYVREDGMLMALREYDDDLAPVDMGMYDIKTVDYNFDRPIYARETQTNYTADGTLTSKPGKVISIEVVKNNETTRRLPFLLAEPFEKYAKAGRKFHNRVLSVIRGLTQEQRKKQRDAQLDISPELHEFLVKSLAITNHKIPGINIPLTLNVNQTPVDEYQITFTIEYELTPNLGFKMAGRSGDKGTITQIRNREDMPVDKAGRPADVVMAPDSSIARSNLARLYEQDYGCAADYTTTEIKKRISFSELRHDAFDFVRQLSQPAFEEIYKYLLGYYECISPAQYNTCRAYSPADQREHLADILRQGIYNFLPIGNVRDSVQAILMLREKYPYPFDTVTFRGEDGVLTESEDRVLIGPIYMMLLDKIADTWSAVSTGKLQHFGVLAPRTRGDKVSLPFRETPVTTIGATEGRIFASYAGRRAIAEMMDRSNNPAAQRMIDYNILASPNPTNIENTVDRDILPYGSTRPIQLVSHAVGTAGTQITYISEKDVPKTNN